MLVYKQDIIKLLKSNGYDSFTILSNNLISQSAMQKFRDDKMVGIKTLDKLCILLDMQPGDLIKYVKE